MNKRIQLFLECKTCCIPITDIRPIFMEIQQDAHCNGFSRKAAREEAQHFYKSVAIKLN